MEHRGTVLIATLIVALSGCKIKPFLVHPGNMITVVNVLEPLTLKCTATSAFEWCTFRHRARQCDVSWEYRTGLQLRECAHFADRAKLTGSYTRNECEITLDKALPSDGGRWECEIEAYISGGRRGSGKAVRRFFEVKVKQQPPLKHNKRKADSGSPNNGKNSALPENITHYDKAVSARHAIITENNETFYYIANTTAIMIPYSTPHDITMDTLPYDEWTANETLIEPTTSGAHQETRTALAGVIVSYSEDKADGSSIWIIMAILLPATLVLVMGTGWWCKKNTTLNLASTITTYTPRRHSNYPLAPPPSPIVTIRSTPREPTHSLHSGTVKRQH